MARATPLSSLARAGFEDLQEAVSGLQRLVDLLGDELPPSLLQEFAGSGSPDAALRSLITLAGISPQSLTQILEDRSASGRLLRVLGASDAIGEFFARDIASLEIFREPTRPSNLKLNFSPESPDARRQLRLLYRRELARVLDFDLAHTSAAEAIADVGLQLSGLADQVLEGALRIATVELQRSGQYSGDQIAEAKLAVISMGKCGARELNYLSDVDVIFVSDGQGETALEIATKLATSMMRIIDSSDSEPPLWTVDPNLRPEGKSGALVRTLSSHEAYFDRWAENWEFQAQIKARCSAGNIELGREYLRRISARVWSRSDRGNIVETVRKMRTRVLDNIPESLRSREIKLGLGGLRDVEFTVQLLQLVHGVAEPSVRSADTLSALSALKDAGFVGRAEAGELADCYRTLRAIEHRVQLIRMERDHIFPILESRRRRIARSMPEVSTLETLDAVWESVRLRVIALTQDIFYRPLLNAMADISPDEVSLSDEEVESRLRVIGFVDTASALRHITALTQGVSRRAQMQRNLLPVLLRWMGEATYPDRGLLAFRRISEALGDSHWFLRMLRDQSGAAERMARVISSSELVPDLLEKIPESSAWFASNEDLISPSKSELLEELSALLERNNERQVAADAVRWVRRRELLRVAIRASLQSVELESQMAALVDLTDAYLEANLALAFRESPEFGERLKVAVIGMGRLGGRELILTSDADALLVFSTVDPKDSDAALADRWAGVFISNCQDQMVPFELDLDLRPEGKKGPRIRSLESFRAYYDRWAEDWEFQALVKARFICGDIFLGSEFLKLVDRFRYPEKLEEKQSQQIRRIKARVEAERLPKGAEPKRNVKLGPGGISDTEWLVQLFQMMAGEANHGLRVTETIGALRAAQALALITDAQANQLESSWQLASRIRSAIFLVTGRSNDQLPEDRKLLAAIAYLLDFESAAALENTYLSSARKTRRIFEAKFFGEQNESD